MLDIFCLVFLLEFRGDSFICVQQLRSHRVAAFVNSDKLLFTRCVSLGFQLMLDGFCLVFSWNFREIVLSVFSKLEVSSECITVCGNMRFHSNHRGNLRCRTVLFSSQGPCINLLLPQRETESARQAVNTTRKVGKAHYANIFTLAGAAATARKEKKRIPGRVTNPLNRDRYKGIQIERILGLRCFSCLISLFRHRYGRREHESSAFFRSLPIILPVSLRCYAASFDVDRLHLAFDLRSDSLPPLFALFCCYKADQIAAQMLLVRLLCSFLRGIERCLLVV